jgi:membrane associated rhomboid family serine protease
MQIHIPDPTYTRSEQARANFRLAVKLSLGFVAFLWLIELLGWGLELERFGIRPREWMGLTGILAAPLLHAGFEHLLANSIPLVVLGTTMLHLYPTAAFRVLPAVYLGPGIAVWLFGQDGVHVGASGLVYGLVSYIFVAGLIRRDRRAIAASLLVAFMYGTLTWGVLPIRHGVSWETHLAAALIGVAMAIALRHADVPPRVQYEWEGHADDEATSPSEEHDPRFDGRNLQFDASDPRFGVTDAAAPASRREQEAWDPAERAAAGWDDDRPGHPARRTLH